LVHLGGRWVQAKRIEEFAEARIIEHGANCNGSKADGQAACHTRRWGVCGRVSRETLELFEEANIAVARAPGAETYFKKVIDL
jgi:hypothetical protein